MSEAQEEVGLGLSVQDWWNLNPVNQGLRATDVAESQIMWWRDRLPGVFFPRDEDSTTGAHRIAEKQITVVGTHPSKSAVLPVVKLELDPRCYFYFRDNFYGVKVSAVLLTSPMEDDDIPRDLIWEGWDEPVKSARCEGMTPSMVFGPWTRRHERMGPNEMAFTVGVASRESLATLLWFFRHRLRLDLAFKATILEKLGAE